MTRAALGIGANIGDRLGNIERAARLLRALSNSFFLASDVYETCPWGMTEQPRFLNACAVIETELPPEALLSVVKEIERKIGRVKRERWGPREIDIDILLYGDLSLELPGLSIPHPRLHERKFVLVPLVKIAPDWVHPKLGLPISGIAAAIDGSEPVRITGL